MDGSSHLIRFSNETLFSSSSSSSVSSKCVFVWNNSILWSLLFLSHFQTPTNDANDVKNVNTPFFSSKKTKQFFQKLFPEKIFGSEKR